MLSLKKLPNKEPDEKIIKVVRRDVFIILKKFILVLLLSLLPLLFHLISAGEDMGGELAKVIIFMCASAYYLFVLLFAFFVFLDYYLDVWIITDERIIDIEQRGYFSRVIAEHKIYRIQDVASEVHGILPTILKYGEVHIQTAGAKQRFDFNQVPDPDGIRDVIIDLMRRSKKKHHGA